MRRDESLITFDSHPPTRRKKWLKQTLRICRSISCLNNWLITFGKLLFGGILWLETQSVNSLYARVTALELIIAEGSGRGTNPEICRFLRIARGSLYETQHWLRRAYRRRLLNEKQVKQLLPLVNELTPKLNAYLRSIGYLKLKERSAK